MAGSVQGTKTPSHSFSALSRDIFDPPKNAQMDGTQGATKQPLRIFKHHPTWKVLQKTSIWSFFVAQQIDVTLQTKLPKGTFFCCTMLTMRVRLTSAVPTLGDQGRKMAFPRAKRKHVEPRL